MHSHTVIEPTIDAMSVAIAVDGGFTYDPFQGRFIRPGDPLIEGYVVAIPGTEGSIPDLLDACARSHMRNTFIGGWWDTEEQRLWLELCHILPNERTARILGHEYGQKAIFDLYNGEEIWL